MSDELEGLEDAGAPSMQPPSDKRLSRYEAAVGAVLVALIGAAIVGGVELRGEVDVISSEVESIKQAQSRRTKRDDDKEADARASAERLARIEAMLESITQRLDRIEREVNRQGDE